MNNSVIDFSRLFSLIKLNLHFNLKRVLFTAGIGLGIATVYLFMFWATRILDEELYFNQHEYLFVLSLYISGFIFAGSSFAQLRSEQGTRDYLMLPASKTEKFIIEAFISAFVYPLFFLLSYWVFSLVANSMLNNVLQTFYMPFSLNIAPYGLALFVYFFIQPVFLFGAVNFQKMPLIKTLLWILLIAASIALLIYCSWLNIDYSEGIDELAMNKPLYSPLVYYRHYLIIPVGLVFCLLTFLKLKEKEA
ncbi:MAG: hypothetical protein ACJAS3_002744 [Roseivirga sp.]|jgi:hypothetical protein